MRHIVAVRIAALGWFGKAALWLGRPIRARVAHAVLRTKAPPRQKIYNTCVYVMVPDLAKQGMCYIYIYTYIPWSKHLVNIMKSGPGGPRAGDSTKRYAIAS